MKRYYEINYAPLVTVCCYCGEKKLGNLGYEPMSEKQEKNSLSKTLLLLTGKHDIIESQII